MNHLNEEQLIAHAYGEDEDKVVQEHLASCAQCTRAYGALSSDLAEIAVAEPPARDAAYGRRVWLSIAHSLPAYEGRTRWLRGGPWRRLSYAVAGIAVVICAFLGGRLWEHKRVQTIAQNHAPQHQQTVARPPQRVLVVVLSDHLDRSERLLVELKHADPDSDQTVSPLRDQARDLLAANQICRRNAKHEDDRALVTALDRLDQLLVELANQPEGLNSATISRLQEEMNTDGLLFEVRVLRSRHAASSTHTKGGTI